MHPNEFNTRRGATRAMFHQGSAINPMLRGPAVSYEPDTGAGTGADENAGEGDDNANDGEGDEGEGGDANDNPGAEGEPKKPSDTEAKLLKDAMKHKKAAKKAAADLAAANAALEKYKGVDPEKVAQLIAAQEAAEVEAAEKRGEYDRIVAQMRDQHTATVEGLQAQITERDNSLAAAMAQIDDLTVGADFGNSKFLQDKTVLSPRKARTLYGPYFDRVDGVTVAYDKPRGAKDRTPLVDANGANLSFEAAIEKIITGDEDFDRIAKSKLKTGAASQGAAHQPADQTQQPTDVSGTSRIAANLKNLPQPKK